MDAFRKLSLYLRACRALGSLNLRGFGALPKRWWPSAPYNRSGFNEFILWIKALQLDQVTQVIDVGANHGDFSQAASRVHPGCRCLLVEPLPTLHDELSVRSQHFAPNWRVVHDAIGDRPGQATLHVDPGMDAIGTLAGFSQEYLTANPEVRPGRTFDCKVRTLDNLCAELNISRVDLLKIDVEGFEFEAVDGAAQVLEFTRSAIVEVSLVRRDQTDPSLLPEMLERFTSRGFQTVEIIPSLQFSGQTWRPKEFNLLLRRR